MTKEPWRFSNRAFLRLFCVIVAAFIPAMLAVLWVMATVGNYSVESLMVGGALDAYTILAILILLIYRQRFQDERSAQILNKSARNGFVFMAFVLPFIIEVEILVGSSLEIVPLLIGYLLCSLALAILSAIYYYRK